MSMKMNKSLEKNFLGASLLIINHKNIRKKIFRYRKSFLVLRKKWKNFYKFRFFKWKKFFEKFFGTKIAKKREKNLQIVAEACPKIFPLSKILAEKTEAIFKTAHYHNPYTRQNVKLEIDDCFLTVI
jgi:hypothetical protein